MSRAAKAGGGAIGTLLLALNLWQQFERTELHDRVMYANRTAERAVSEIQSSRDECGEATGQLARLVNSCADWCAGE